MVAIEPLSKYSKCSLGCLPSSRSVICRAAKRAPWMATWATPGRPSSAIMSPTTKTSGCPGTVRSGSTCTRPARSRPAPDCSAICRPSGLACTPAAQTLVRASMRLEPPSGPLTVMPVASTSVTIVPRRTSTPIAVSRRRAASPSRSPKVGSTASAASSRMMRACRGSMRRKSLRRVRWASSAIWPAISTPVGPAPTTTKVRARSRSAGVRASSASSKAPKMRPRSSRASSIDFMPGACRANSSWPNQDWPEPAETRRLS